MTKEFLERRLEELKKHAEMISQQYCTINGRVGEITFLLNQMEIQGEEPKEKSPEQ